MVEARPQQVLMLSIGMVQSIGLPFAWSHGNEVFLLSENKLGPS